MGKKRVIEKTGDSAGAQSEVIPAKSGKGGRKAKSIETGKVYIKSSYNNTMITVTDEGGGVVAWATAGALGFNGPKKATPFAASKVTAAIAEKVAKTGPRQIHIYVSGVGPGRDSAIRSLVNHGFEILSIKDVTPIPHNGPKPVKPRRV